MTDAPLHWRKSTYSGTSSECVEVAKLASGGVLVRNSNHADAGTLRVGAGEAAAWIEGVRAGALDDFTS